MKPYKGFRATVAFDDDDMVFHGRLAGIQDVIGFEAETAEDLVQAFHDSVDDYLEFCAEQGVTPQKPFSGALSLRMTPEQHRRISDAAAKKAMSLNQWIVAALDRKAEDDLAGPMTVK